MGMDEDEDAFLGGKSTPCYLVTGMHVGNVGMNEDEDALLGEISTPCWICSTHCRLHETLQCLNIPLVPPVRCLRCSRSRSTLPGRMCPLSFAVERT